MREPSFWWRPPGLLARLLMPASALYGAVAARAMARPGQRALIPLVCIGNLTLGGAGKTPTALAVALMLRDAGHRPFFLTRGYGGRLSGPVRVDLARHTAADVGDEPLLLARVAPTVVAHDRPAGAQAAAAAGASVVVMDDGFQNPSLIKDFSVLVLDGRRGTGNARVNPAGPLRAPLAAQVGRASALIVIGKAGPASEPALAAARARALALFEARLAADPAAIARLRQSRHLAFAGIGDPQKFFATLDAAGLDAPVKLGFPDHHRYTRAQSDALCARATREGLELLTTEKDLARLIGDNEVAELARRARGLPVRVELTEEAAFRRLLLKKIGSPGAD